MRTGAIVSGLFHIVIIVLTMLGLPFFWGRELEPAPAIDIEFVQLSELTNVEATVKDVEKPSPEPPQPKAAEETVAAVAPDQLELAPPELDAPKPDKIPEPAPEPEPQKEEKAPPKPVKAPQKPPEKQAKKKNEPTVDDIMASFLGSEAQKVDENAAKSDKDREKVGAGTARLATQRDAIAGMLRSQIERCWSPPIGAPDAEQLVVSLDVSLGPDGKVQGLPQIVDTSRMGDVYYRAAAEAAQRAVINCSPYQLPAEDYEVWKEIQFNMDPKEILG